MVYMNVAKLAAIKLWWRLGGNVEALGCLAWVSSWSCTQLLGIRFQWRKEVTCTFSFTSENRCLCTHSEQPCVTLLIHFHAVELVKSRLISFCLTIWLFVLFHHVNLKLKGHSQGLTSPTKSIVFEHPGKKEVPSFLVSVHAFFH